MPLTLQKLCDLEDSHLRFQDKFIIMAANEPDKVVTEDKVRLNSNEWSTVGRSSGCQPNTDMEAFH